MSWEPTKGSWGSDDRQAGTRRGGREIAAQFGHGRLAGGAVKGEDDLAHLRPLSCRQPCGDRSGDASGGHAVGTFVERASHQVGDRFLAHLVRLPLLCEVVPDVVRMEHTQGVTDPDP